MPRNFFSMLRMLDRECFPFIYVVLYVTDNLFLLLNVTAYKRVMLSQEGIFIKNVALRQD